jgi:hypothetical protein
MAIAIHTAQIHTVAIRAMRTMMVDCLPITGTMIELRHQTFMAEEHLESTHNIRSLTFLDSLVFEPSFKPD